MDTFSTLPAGIAWLILWSLGGWWLVRSFFNLRDDEQLLTGISLGLVVQAWAGNLLAQVLPVMAAFWLGAVLTFTAGLAGCVWRAGWKGVLQRPKVSFLQLAGWGVLLYLLIAIGRGMAISDDFQNLPIAAMLSMGSIPLRFPLDPSISYPYHYLNLLMAGQFIRLFNLFTWTGVDVARGLTFSLAIMLAGFWGRRLTRSSLAGFLNGIVFALAGGTRWLFLLLPQFVLQRVNQHILLIGSGKASAPDLISALNQAWATSGAGPYAFPFAYVNGFNPPLIINYHSGGGAVGALIIWLLLLMFNRSNARAGLGILSILLAALALTNEVQMAFLCLGFGFVLVYDLIKRRSLRPSRGVLSWFLIVFAAGLISLVQGGVITSAVFNQLTRWQGQTVASYHSFNFSWIFPPALITGHLGKLVLFDPEQLLAAFIEIGPIFFGLPLLVWWGIKSLRAERWFEAALVLSSLFGLFFVFTEFSGEAGPTALIRIQNLPFGLLSFVLFPLVCLWAARFSRGIKIGLGLGVASMLLGGIVLLAVQLMAVPQPVNSFFLNDLDAQAAADYWNRLPSDARIFSSNPSRAPILFGRYTNSSIDYFHSKPEWDEMFNHPDPYQWRAYGFTYAYLDRNYFETELNLDWKNRLNQASCMQLLKSYTQENPADYRLLYDINGCQ